MIKLLLDAFSVLLERGENCVQTLENEIRVGKLQADQRIPITVTDRCLRIEEPARIAVDDIADKLEILRALEQSLNDGVIIIEHAEPLLTAIFKSYRERRRYLEGIEENFIGHLARFNDSDLFFSLLAASIWEEANLPDIPPVAVTSTSGYFCTLASFGIIFSPPSIEHNLLIIPDLVHEFGHVLHEGGNVKLLGQRFEASLEAHIQELENQVRRTSRPIDQKLIIDIAGRWDPKWEPKWAEEVACDTLATFLLGPAYAWCNLHLCLQNSNAHQYQGEHPADAARSKHVIRVLRRMGYGAVADEIEGLWMRYLTFSGQGPHSHYLDYHPDDIFIAIMEDVEEAIADHGIGSTGACPTLDLLNSAWAEFNKDRDGYAEWQKQTLSDLKTAIMQTS